MISESQLSILGVGLLISVLFNGVGVHNAGDLNGSNPAPLYQRLKKAKQNILNVRSLICSVRGLLHEQQKQ